MQLSFKSLIIHLHYPSLKNPPRFKFSKDPLLECLQHKQSLAAGCNSSHTKSMYSTLSDLFAKEQVPPNDSNSISDTIKDLFEATNTPKPFSKPKPITILQSETVLVCVNFVNILLLITLFRRLNPVLPSEEHWGAWQAVWPEPRGGGWGGDPALHWEEHRGHRQRKVPGESTCRQSKLIWSDKSQSVETVTSDKAHSQICTDKSAQVKSKVKKVTHKSDYSSSPSTSQNWCTEGPVPEEQTSSHSPKVTIPPLVSFS